MAEAQTLSKTNDLQVPFEKLGLKIGDPLHLEGLDHSGRYQVKLIGYAPGQSIVVTAPMVENKQVLLKKDRPFTVRSLAQNNAFAFQSRVLAVPMQPFLHVHLEYPKEMMTIQVRNAARLVVEMPTRVLSEFDTGTGEWPKSGLIYDISKTGAGLRSEQSLGIVNDEILLQFNLTVAGISKTFKISAIIRNKTRLAGEYLPYKFNYGLQFCNLSDAAKIVLSGFIYELQSTK